MAGLAVQFPLTLAQQLREPDDVPEGQDWRSNISEKSLEVLTDARVEPSLKAAVPGTRFQFERLGYFTVDKDATSDLLVFNRTVTLKDTWAKEVKKAGGPAKTSR